MSRSNYDKPFYVDVGTSVAAIRCASNHDVVCSLDYTRSEHSIKLIEEKCERMNREFELYAKLKAEAAKPTCNWSVKDALAFANTLANNGFTREANADAASSCIYALCRMLKDGGNPAALRNALKEIADICDGRANAANPSPSQDMFIIYNLAKAALAEPARNCDIFTTVAKVIAGFRKWCGKHDWDKCKSINGGCDSCLTSWMLSTAAEGDKA